MLPFRLGTLRPAWAVVSLLVTALIVTACGGADPSPTPTADPAVSSTPTVSPTPLPTPEPTPTPAPTPRFTNEPDPELSDLIPRTIDGIPVVIPQVEEFALTPGDFGTAYGEIGDRFRTLGLAYIEAPRASLYVARVEGEPVTTEDLEPHLATAGRYVGIAGLDRESWELVDVDGSLAWVRPEDNATALGTMIYTWSSGEFVFLLIGVDDAVNRALFSALPAEPAPTPSPSPTPDPSPTDGESPTPMPTGG
ncbi:MAG TPA: hypothetical protein VLA76_06955 [Candidatus Angelobacter sp.]|nr:hypothetical protein [Candidatus Angelobacter sp.]